MTGTTDDSARATRDESLGLYVHFPWCVSKCPYCDFNSHGLRGPLPEDAYVDALMADLEWSASSWPGQTLSTVFFGGGTPSLMAPGLAEALVERVATRWSLDTDAEINCVAIDREDFREEDLIHGRKVAHGVAPQ